MKNNLEEVEGKKKIFKDKKNIAIIILSILLLFAICGSSENSIETSNSLPKEENIQVNQDKIQELEREKNVLIQEKEKLETEKNELYIEKQDLENERNQLQKEKQDLETQKGQLEEENKNLENERNQLQKEKEDLETQTSTLEQEKTTLSDQLEQLKNKLANQKTTSNSTSSTSQTSTSTQNTNSAIVYVTETGKKYHKSGCSYLKKSKIQINLSDAKAQGYTPCSKCY